METEPHCHLPSHTEIVSCHLGSSHPYKVLHDKKTDCLFLAALALVARYNVCARVDSRTKRVKARLAL